MRPDFDAELYLRLAGERAILDGPEQGGRPWDSPLAEAGAALAAVDALSSETAQNIVDDYQTALGLRGRHGGGPPHRFRPPRTTRASAVELQPSRVVVVEEDLEQPWGRLHVHYIVLGDRSTVLAVTATGSSPARRGRSSIMGWGPGSGPPVSNTSVTDEQGTTVGGDFSGGGSDDEWTGFLTCTPPLSVTTPWLDIGGTRVELRDREGEPPSVTVEHLPPASPAERFLRMRLATSGHGPHFGMRTSLDASIEALVAAGAVHESDPVVAEVRAVTQHFGPPHRGGPVPQLPQPWGSLFGRTGAADEVRGSVAVGVVTPTIDGVVVAFDALMASDEGFEVHITASPPVVAGHGPFGPTADDPQIAWWAEDNRGNHFLGGMGSWSASDDTCEGTVRYWPSLDPAATELRLIPTAATMRAVITLSNLPWVRPR